MRRVVAYLALGLAGLFGAGLAYSAIPETDGSIHACYDNTSGALRVIDPGAGQECRPGSETALNWNQKGPAGAQGPPGPAIPAGSTPELPSARDPAAVDNPVGKLAPRTLRRLDESIKGEPTKVFSVFNDKGGLLPPDESPELTVLRLPLPAGKYVVIAKGTSTLATGVPENYLARCRVQIGSDSDETRLARRGPWVTTVVGRLKKPRAAELRCWTFGPTVAGLSLDVVSDLKLTAINVAAISNGSAKLGQ